MHLFSAHEFIRCVHQVFENTMLLNKQMNSSCFYGFCSDKNSGSIIYIR